MHQRILTYLLAAAALGLILLGMAWNSLFPPSSYWSEEKALEYRDAFRAAHAAQDAASHGAHTGDDAQVLKTRANYERIQDELNQAQTARGRTGFSLVLVGLLLFLASLGTRRAWSDSPATKDA
jgi:hypothetical protein